MAENFNSDEFKKQREEIEKIVEIQKELNSGNVGLFETLKDIHRYDKLIADQVKKRNRLKAVEEKIQKRISALESKKLASGSVEEEQNTIKIIKLEEEKALTGEAVKLQNKKIDQHKLANRLIKQEVKDVRTLSNLLKTSVNEGLKKGLALAKKTGSYYIEQDAAVRATAKSMGVLSKQADAFANNIFKASLSTNQLGIQAKDLAKIQGVYSSEVGRALMLSQDGLEAMAEMAAGTNLGAEGAAMMAANMESFGMSATMSRDLLQETVDLAHTMGVNTDAAVKNLSINLKKAQGYNFKKGVKGITEMSVRAAKFGVSMDMATGFADKLIDIEGAVDMAAQLQVLGGGFAKIADPFKLMFQARNDVEGLQKSLEKATEGIAHFDDASGTFKISAVEMHRLRKVAEPLGQDYAEIAKNARAMAKFSKMKGELGMKVDPEIQEFITSTAKFNKGAGGYEIMIGDNLSPKLLKSLNADDIKLLEAQALQKDSLAQQAKNSQTFDKLWGNLMNTFKSVLLPFVKGIDSGLRKPLEAFMNDDSFKKTIEELAEFGKTLGKGIGKAAELIMQFPKTSLALVAALGAAKWFSHGVTMGLGFKSITGGLGKGGGGLGVGGKTTANTMAGKGLSGKMGKFGTKMAGKGMGAGLALGAGSMGLDMWRDNIRDRDSGAGKAMGIGSSALAGAGTGAMIGSIIPGIGTAAGAVVGGLAGGAYGAYNEYGGDKKKYTGRKQEDFVMRPGEGAVPFSSSDTLVGAKPGGPIDKLLDKGGGGGASSGIVSVKFDKPLVIKGEITLNNGSSLESIKLNDPILMREIASIVQQELRKSLGGGKLNPNPV